MAKPVKKFRAGQVSCALWENEVNVQGRTVTVLKATVERRYRDAQGNWKSGNSFNRNEIPLVVYCLEKAFEAMVDEQNLQPDEAGKQEEVE
jgi:hypothetical protein